MRRLFFLLLLAVPIITGCGSNSKNERNIPGTGETAIINQQCLSASSMSAMDELNKVSNARDEIGLKEMLLNGRAAILEKNTKVLIMSGGSTYTLKVRVQEGKHKDRALFVAFENVSKTK